VAAALLGAIAVASDAFAASPPGAFTTRGAWSFVSAPRLHPPKLLTLGKVDRRHLARGDFLMANLPNQAAPGPMTGQGGPLIVDQKLRPVWFAPVGTQLVSSDLQQESYQGQPVLVWWQGELTDTGGTLRGQVVVVNQHYRRVAALQAKRPWVISLHDAVISGNAIWVTVYRYVKHQNLKPYGGRRGGTVYDAGVQEYDLTSGKLLFTWDALNPGHKPHIPLAASEQPASVATAPGSAWDAYHVNSIQVLPGKRILVSMRNTWAAYLIDTTTGKIIWTLGGKRPWNSFRFGRGASFAWQHDVQFVSRNQVTLFDDACCRLEPGRHLGPSSGTSRGLVLRLGQSRHTASLVASYPHRPRISVLFLGSMQLLPNHNALVGWGSLPYFSEYSRTSKQLLDVRFPGKDQSYRTFFSSTWIGTPFYPPHGAVRRSHGRTTVYASWNGATQVAHWQVLAGATPTGLTKVAAAPRSGFETAISLKTGNYRYFEVRAVSGIGKVLGTSRTFQ
jgi:hypothetical protein